MGEWFDSILAEYTPVILREALVIFSTLGIVYFTGRLLFPKMKERGKNIVAAGALLFTSFLFTLVYDYAADITTMVDFYFYVTDSFVYSAIGAVFYVVIGWRFYNRMDNLLDSKLASDRVERRKK